MTARAKAAAGVNHPESLGLIIGCSIEKGDRWARRGWNAQRLLAVVVK
jgi:hypothetical protein